ncbi:helix-turn-helix domain-containing protein [Kribbella speibonae]|uniref:Helix-turn-helix domain-containing protein n=1 Tax=Kribbella speibonae TaxID=1572660 RepID=A0A4R0IFQ0_9ACTN|nr:helix-turn-helix domain-containing protein [Kribbella speibonae]
MRSFRPDQLFAWCTHRSQVVDRTFGGHFRTSGSSHACRAPRRLNFDEEAGVTEPGPSTFGELLRGWRERALLTQEELAERAGVDPRTLRRWETGQSARPRGSSLRQVAEVLGLTDDESLEMAAAARGPALPTSDRPHQLPPAPSHFVGREAELAALSEHVAEGRAVIAVEGMAGVGKTAFAVEAGRMLAPDFPDGQIFIDLHGFSDRTRPLEPDEALARMLRALGVPGDQFPVDVEERASLFRSLIADRRLLFVYDNVARASQVAPLLPANPACQVLTTSRNTLASLDRGATIRLGTLPQSAAIDLFTRASESLGLPASDLDRLTEVVELCGCLPLALRIAAARLRTRPSWQLAELVLRLQDQRGAVLDRLDDETLGVSAALDLSYAALDEPTRRAYRLTGVIPGPDIDLGAAAALFGTNEVATRSALETLQDLHLLSEGPAGRYSMHDLTRTHAAWYAGSTETAQDRSDALIRLFDHYCAWASAAMDLAHPYTRSRRPDPPYVVKPNWTVDEANGWLDTELPNLLAIAQTAGELEMPRYVVDLAGVVHRRLIMRNLLREAEVLHRSALQAAEELGDRAAVARAHGDLGRVLRRQYDYPAAAAHFARALSLATAEGLTLVEVEAHFGLAATVQYGGSSVDPDEHLARALRLAEDVGDDLGQLESHSTIAHARLSEGAYQSAVTHFDQALAMARRVGYRAREVDALVGRGRADAELGRTAAAVDGFRRAVELSRQEGLPIGELAGMYNLGNAVRRSGDPSAALDSYREVLEVALRIGSENWQYEAHQGLGRASVDLGDGHSAIEHHRQARLLAERSWLRPDLARAEDGLAAAYAVLGDQARARQHWQTALALLEEAGVDHTDDPETSQEAIGEKLRG